jgi:DNA mismatch repair protein MutS
MMRQYLDIKRVHQDKILFFRLGDFYEMFFDDAKTAARVLNLTLTGRGSHDEGRIPMAGIPFHAADNYIARLLKAGHSIAICDQTEDPALAKGLVKREVTRVITPGTVLSASMLDDKANNYLAAVCLGPKEVGFAVVDVSTGEFKACEAKGDNRLNLLFNELARFAPSEILLAQSFPTAGETGKLLTAAPQAKISRMEDWKFSIEEATGGIQNHFQVKTLEGFGLSGQPYAVRAAGALLSYLRETTHSVLSHLVTLSALQVGEGLVLDAATQRNLEILKSMRDGSMDGTLRGVLDETATAMGGRLLKQYLVSPLTSVSEIRRRQDAVEELLSDRDRHEGLRERLHEVSDLERLAGRVGCSTANGRDLAALRTTLKILPEVHTLASGLKAALVKDRVESWDNLKDLAELLEKALTAEPPLALKEGGLIREGYHEMLDELKKGAKEGKDWIAALEEKEKKRTGVSSLKVRYTSVFGYYIEVSKANLDKVPEDYHRKQTLVNAERFITPELKAMEGKVLGAQEKADKLEYELFDRLRTEVGKHLPRLQRMARTLAELDVLASFAQAALKGRYIRPEVDDSLHLVIEEGRHPVLDRLMPSDQFVPNDTHLAEDETRIIVLTGPNMAGKSTYIRQTALLTLMAQVGSFVPAKSMQLGVVDRIFTRVGASDALTQGQSTFMVEMVETANILNNATSKSLLILDEVGRGTSTFDGMSIAWAVVEHLSKKIQARTLFATHYHELTQLAADFSNVKNFNIAVREWNDQILFLRKIVPGGADKSYGIQVARLAGVPKAVVERAKRILAGLESGSSHNPKPEIATEEEIVAGEVAESGATLPQLSFFGSGPEHPVLAELKALDMDGLTPREALNLISDWKNKLE